MQFGLPDDVLPRLTGLLSSNDKVISITLFGSRAKGNYRAGSDIDLCLDAEGLSLPELFVLENRVDDLLLPWKVDIAVLQKISNPALSDHIKRIGVKIYEAGSALVPFAA